VSSLATDLIGVTAIPLLSVPLPTSAANRQSLMVKRLSQNGNGASDFETLSTAMRRQPHSIILYAFDLLHLDGKDLRQQTLMERLASLKTLLGTDGRSRIQFSDEFDGDGAALFKACAERELEGIVSKHSRHLIAPVAARRG
jgi:ATP-dependent DNA ligase